VLLKATNPGIEANLRFPGQYFDEESNLSYNYFRSYNAAQGRYSQPDLIGLEGGWNRFGYVEGNPLSYTDPNGLQVAPGSAPHRPVTPNLNPGNKLDLSPHGQCMLACQAMGYPICAAAGYGVNLSFSAIATPLVGLGAQVVIGGVCNATVARGFCEQRCQPPAPQTCTPALTLPALDPNAQMAR